MRKESIVKPASEGKICRKKGFTVQRKIYKDQSDFQLMHWPGCHLLTDGQKVASDDLK